MADYFNCPSENCSNSSGACSAHPDWVMCDDFDDGIWYATMNDETDPDNDGWYGCNDVVCGNPEPPAVSPNGDGRGGSGYAAMSTLDGGEGGFAALGMHGFYPANAEYDELWIRMYLRLLPGYFAKGGQKFISLIGTPYGGGIDHGGLAGAYVPEMWACPQWTCGELNEGYLIQNQGNDIAMQDGTTWYFIEWHVKLNTPNVRNGEFRMWINDCGSSGNCTGSPTLRAEHTSVGWRGGSSTRQGNGIASLWMDIWGNNGDDPPLDGSDEGSIYMDNMVVSTSGPIGFVGSEGGGGGSLLQKLRAHPFVGRSAL